MGLGIFGCQKKESLLEKAKNELELSEAIRQEKNIVKSQISRNIYDDKNLIRDIRDQSFNKHVVPKLKSIVSDLGTNFIQIVFCQFLEEIELRIKNEKYYDFEEIKKKFIIFYRDVNEDCSYNSLMNKTKEFNEYLNNKQKFD